MDTGNQNLFRVLFFVNFSITLGFGIADAFFSVFARGLGARGLILGAAIGLYATSKIIFSPFMGALSDRFGRKIIIVASLSLFFLVSLCYLQSTDPQLIIVLRMLQGIGCAMFRPVVLSLIGESAPAKNRGTAIATFDISFYAALSSGPLIGGIIMDRWGFNGIFYFLSSLCLLALFVALRYIPADRHQGAAAKRQRTSLLTATALNSTPQSALPGLLVYIFGRACGIITFVSFMPILLSSKFGFSGTQIGIIMASTSVIMTLFLKPMGKLADRMSRPALIIVGGGMVSVIYLLIPSADSFNQMLLLGIGIGLFSGISQPASTALLVEEGKRYGSGFAVGTFNASLNLGLTIGSLIGASLLISAGLSVTFYLAGLFGLFAVGIFAILTRSRPNPKPC